MNEKKEECNALQQSIVKVQSDYEKVNADIRIFETAIAAAQSERGIRPFHL
jgi:archaellum component FlaC